jgi:hypothetical protein
MIMEIITNTPAWVFVIFALVVARGVSAMRTRPVQMQLLTGFALAFLAFGAQSAWTRSGTTPWPMLAWLAAVALGCCGQRQAAQQKGSIVPLVLVLLIFSSRYVAGVLNVMHPELLDPQPMRVLLCAVYGVLTGVLAGRTLRVGLLVRDLPGSAAPGPLAA